MSTKTEDVEAAIKRLTHLAEIFAEGGHVSPLLDKHRERDLRTLLASHAAQAERVATLEAGVRSAQSFIADGGLADMYPGSAVYSQLTAPLSGKASA